MECLRLTWDFILSLRHWGPDPEAEPLLPPDESQFPPPDTRLSPPRPHRRPRLPGTGTGLSSQSSLDHLIDAPGGRSGGPTRSAIKQSLERLKQADQISKEFSGRMRSVRTSQPPTPSTGFFGSTGTLATPQAHTGARTQPLPTPIPLPNVPQPANRVPSPHGGGGIARSVSAPTLDWGEHQLPRDGQGGIVVRRPRANTLATRADMARRGRNLANIAPLPIPPAPAGQLGLAAALASGSAIDSGDESEGPVVRRDLGIRELYRGNNRSRGRGRPGRGRATTH